MGNYTPFFIYMDDSREIIYLALSNLFISYSNALRLNKMNQDEKKMTQYIIERSEQLMKGLEEDIKKENNQAIPKPKWNNPIG